MAKKSQAQPVAAASVAVADGPRSTTAGFMEIRQVPIATIVIKNKVDRTRDEAFNAAIAELAASIAQVGLQQPIGLRPIDGGQHELVFGERRLLAFRSLKLEKIPAKILNAEEAEVALEIRAAENFQRSELNDDQKALVVSEMVDREFERVMAENGGKDENAAVDDPRVADAVRTKAIKRVAERIGWPVPRIRDFAFIGELPAKTRALVASGRLSTLHARVLAQVADPDACDRIAKEHAAGEDPASEPMASIDDLRHAVRKDHSRLDQVPWDLDAEFAGAKGCNACAFNSRNQTGLFDGTTATDSKGGYLGNYGNNGKIDDKAVAVGVCMKLECFKAKNNASKSAIRGAGDRIAGKAAKLGEKERPVEVGRLVREATEKASFVKPTVFGKQVRERVQAKLEQAPKDKKSKASKGSGSKGVTGYDTYNSPEAKAHRAAKEKFQNAQRKWMDPVFKRLLAKLEKRPVLAMLIAWVVISEPFEDCVPFEGMKPADVKAVHAAYVKAETLLLKAVEAGDRHEQDPDLTCIASEELGQSVYDVGLVPATFKDRETLLHTLLAKLGEDVSGIPLPPKWDDFDPTKKKAAETPAKTKPAAKDRTPAKAGKKKSKMSKAKPAAAAATGIDADAAGEIDPQDEV